MLFRPPARETIQSLRSILQNLEETTDPESIDLAYLRRLMMERIAELEAAQRFESSATETPSTDREAA